MRTLAILCGGRGLRLGGIDKAELRVGGEPILERLSRLRPSVEDAFLVDAAAGAPRYGLRRVVDLEGGRGAPGGVLTALTEARPGWVAVIGCDMPFVTAEVLGALFAATSEGVDAVCVRSDAGLEPLLAVYATVLRPAVERLVASGGSLRSLLAGVRCTALPLSQVDPSGRAVAGLNTPADLERWRAERPAGR